MFRYWFLRPVLRALDRHFTDLLERMRKMNAAQKQALVEASARIVAAVSGVGTKVTEEAVQVREALDALTGPDPDVAGVITTLTNTAASLEGLALTIDEIVADPPEVPPEG